jgi:uncharacterized C2H2 Zn-finger protein
MRLFRNKKTDKQSIFACKHCDMKFEDKERLQRHTKKAHGEKGGDIKNTNPFGF